MAALTGRSFGYSEYYALFIAICDSNEARLDECRTAIEYCDSEESVGVICEGTCNNNDIVEAAYYRQLVRWEVSLFPGQLSLLALEAINFEPALHTLYYRGLYMHNNNYFCKLQCLFFNTQTVNCLDNGTQLILEDDRNGDICPPLQSPSSPTSPPSQPQPPTSSPDNQQGGILASILVPLLLILVVLVVIAILLILLLQKRRNKQ